MKYIGTEEAARRLGISINDVRALCRSGEIKGCEKDIASRQWKIPLTSIEEMVRARSSARPRRSEGLLAKILSLVVAQRTKTRTAFGLIISAVVFTGVLVAIASDFDGAVRQLEEWGIISKVPAALDTEIMVLIATFKGSPEYDPTTRIYNTLVHSLEARNIRGVRVERTDDAPTTRNEASSLGIRYRASMVIWGTYDSAAIEPRLEVLESPAIKFEFDLLEQMVNTNLASYNAFISRDLPTMYEYFTLLTLGQILLNKSDTEYGIELLGEAIALVQAYPSLPIKAETAYQLRGLAHFSASNLENALADLEIAVYLDAESLNALSALAAVQTLLGDYSTALTTVRRAQQLKPDFWNLFDIEGLIYYKSGHYELAMQAFDRSIELFPGDINMSEAMMSEMRSVIYSHRALVHAALKDYERARHDYEVAVSDDPNSAVLYHNWGFMELDAGNARRALDHFETSLQLGSDDVRTLQGRGVAHRNLGEFAAALRDFEGVINLAPTYGGGYYERGVLLRAQGRLEDALADFSRTIVIWPDNIMAFEMRVYTLFQLNRGEDAMSDIATLMELEPEDGENYYMRGLYMYLNSGVSESVLNDFEASISLAPNDPRGYFGFGLARESQGNMSEANHYYSLALEINQNFTSALIGRGRIHYAEKEFQLAINDFTRAAELGDVTAYLARSHAYVAIGEPYKALNDCQHYLREIHPSRQGQQCGVYNSSTGEIYSLLTYPQKAQND